MTVVPFPKPYPVIIKKLDDGSEVEAVDIDSLTEDQFMAYCRLTGNNPFRRHYFNA